MNKRLLSAVIALVITLGGANFTLLNAASHGGGHGDHTELGEQMETISKAFRALRRQASDPAKNADSAELAGKMLAAAKEAAKHDPAWTSEQPKAEQAEFVAGYKKGMEHMVALLTDLEKAFKAGENDKAGEIIGKLRDAQKHGHEHYKKPDDE
ncbi:MAG: hypothetical protein KJT03_16890 [Verrucomicrobiae bacterium]|nr:hypothetical protein [Verrucomicrobiae bacterium]